MSPRCSKLTVPVVALLAGPGRTGRGAGPAVATTLSVQSGADAASLGAIVVVLPARFVITVAGGAVGGFFLVLLGENILLGGRVFFNGGFGLGAVGFNGALGSNGGFGLGRGVAFAG